MRHHHEQVRRLSDQCNLPCSFAHLRSRHLLGLQHLHSVCRPRRSNTHPVLSDGNLCRLPHQRNVSRVCAPVRTKWHLYRLRCLQPVRNLGRSNPRGLLRRRRVCPVRGQIHLCRWRLVLRYHYKHLRRLSFEHYVHDRNAYLHRCQDLRSLHGCRSVRCEERRPARLLRSRRVCAMHGQHHLLGRNARLRYHDEQVRRVHC